MNIAFEVTSRGYQYAFPNSFYKQTFYELSLNLHVYNMESYVNVCDYCQAQPKPKSKLEAEMVIFSIVTTILTFY